jgi:hypothetical protein
VEGDFCDHNPRYTYDAGAGGLVAGASGALVGRFCWTVPPPDIDGTNSLVNNFGAGAVAGFLHRNQQGLITVYLQDASLLVPAGFPLALFTGGGFFVKNRGTTEAIYGQKAYANFADGSCSFAATASPSTGASATGSSVAAETSSFTGSISGSQLTVAGVVTGTVYPGTTLSGTNVATGTVITSQVSGTPGGDGIYEVSIPEQTVASTTISGTYGLMTVGTITAGNFGIGDNISGSSVVAGTTVTQYVTGTGGTGSTMVVSNNTVVSSTTISAAGNVETTWYARSSGLAGELVKISNMPIG